MKTYKGLDLVKAVANYEITQGTKLKCIHPVYRQGIEVDENKTMLIWSDTKEPIRYPHFLDSQFEFEIIEEEKDIEIEELEYYKITDETISGLRRSINELNYDYVNKINEIVRKLKEKE